MSTKVESSKSSAYAENVSIRAQKRKRAYEHYRRKHKVKKPSIVSEELSNETTYYVENGLRKVYPYYFNFKTYVKGRWLGKTVLDVYKAEFKQEGIDPEDEIRNGNITVNGKNVPPDFVLRDNMMLEHKCHRHEMPVLDVPIEIIEDTDELLVINKPASIPVHPCGRYRYNSVTMLLKHDLGYDNLRILYRLDRLTSGLLIMPKTTSVSRKLEKQLGKKELYKEYVCRVDGKFPDGEVVCNEPLGCMSYKLSLYRVDKDGKPSSTSFTRLSYNGKSSVVRCVPHTGRTHQIRVHLQFLGYPICNDPLYNNTAFGPNKGKGGVIEIPQDELEAEIMKTSNIGKWKIGDNPKYYEKFGKNKLDADKPDESTADSRTDNVDSTKHCDVPPTISNTSSVENIHSCDDDLSSRDRGTAQICDEKINSKVEKTGIDPSVNNDSDSAGLDSVSVDCKPDKSGKDIDNGSELGIGDKENSLEHTEKRMKLEENLSEAVVNDQNNLSQDIDYDGIEETKSDSDNCPNTDTTLKNVECIGQLNMSDEVCNESRRMLAEKVTDCQLVDSKLIVDEFCVDCRSIFDDPKPEELIIYLHAVKYKGANWEYSTALPNWAREDFEDEKHTELK